MICLPPAPTLISPRPYSSPFSRRNLAAIAALSSGVPSTAVYLVRPASIAATAAPLTWSGVSKSGSPAASAITSRPAAFNSNASPATAIVGEGLIAARRAARIDIWPAPQRPHETHAKLKEGRSRAQRRARANAELYWPRRTRAAPVVRELGVINRAVGACRDWLVAVLPTRRHSR